jgi:hypothetical protein
MDAGIPEEPPEVVAWNKARIRKRIELVSAIAAGIGFSIMFSVFVSILTKQ